MGARREDVDLEIVLKDPKCAREWIRNYDWGHETPTYINVHFDGLNIEKILLESMTDQQVILVAKTILYEIEIERVKNQKAMAEELGEVH